MPPSKLGDATRASIKALLRLVCVGPAAPALVLSTPPIPEDDDYSFDRALLELARAIVARQRGQRRVAAQHLRTASAYAASAGADADLLPRLHDALLRAAAAAGAEHGDVEVEHRLVIDGMHHEIRSGKRRIALEARPASRQLLYAFAAAPANHLSRTMIARVLWDTDYDPLRRDSSLKSSIRRLRALLAGLAEVRAEPDGYRLVLPAYATFVPPAPSGDG